MLLKDSERRDKVCNVNKSCHSSGVRKLQVMNFFLKREACNYQL